MNNDRTGSVQSEMEHPDGIGLPPPTRPAPPMPECKPARSISERRNIAACVTLERLGYTWGGGAEWKPPLGQAPNFDLLDAARAEIEELRLQLASFNQVLHGEYARVDIEAIAKAARGEFDESGGIYFQRKFWGVFAGTVQTLLALAKARNEVQVGTAPEFMKAAIDRMYAAAGIDKSEVEQGVDAPLETSEDEARPYRAGDEKADQVVDADYWAGDEEAISKALEELDHIAQAYDRHDMGLPLWLPEQHDKLAEVLRKMLADQRAALAQAQPTEMTAAARDVLAERKRQQEVEGWTPEHDDMHTSGNLALAAAFYAANASASANSSVVLYGWPWHPSWYKKTTPRRDLEKAGALILAEIERLDRAAEKGGEA